VRRSVAPIFVALAACQVFYHVDPTETPSDGAHADGAHGDGGSDASADAPPDAPPGTPCTPPTMWGSTVAIGTAITYYVAAGSAATWFAMGHVMEGTASTGSSIVGAGDKAFTDANAVSEPRLAPDGDYLLGLLVSGPTNYLAQATRGSGGPMSWSIGTLTALPGGPTVIPSTPTTDELDCLIDTGSGEFLEMRRGSATGLFQPGATHGSAELGTTGSREPSLSPDGLRVTYVGSGSAGGSVIYYADRSAVGSAFEPATVLYPGSAITGTPQIGPMPATPVLYGCSALPFSTNDGTLYFVTP
jgi:hypothetical protein